MKTRKKQPVLFLTTFLIVSSLACNAATNLVNTPTPTAPTPTFTLPPPSPTAIPPTSTATAIPTSTPIVNCKDVFANILASVTQDGHAAKELRGWPDGEEKNDFYTLTIYRVNGEKITLVSDEPAPEDLIKLQEQKELHQKVWDYYVKLIPLNQRGMMGEFEVVTDGKGKLLAAVRLTDDSPYKWILEVDVADVSSSKELTYTLIHEFAHLLTLNSKQISPNRAVFNNPNDGQVYTHEEMRCDRFFSHEGCSQPDSYINSFYEEFWADIHAEWKKTQMAYDSEDFYDSLNNFYKKYQDRFVTDYAVVNPVEDIAESFSFFILSPKPAGDTIAEKKILFFHGFPELVKLREEIQSRACSLNP